MRQIGDECILVPVGEATPFENSMLTFNETAAFMWKMFMEGSTPRDVLEAAMAEYESDEELRVPEQPRVQLFFAEG